MAPGVGKPSISTIIDDQLYLGNISAALSEEKKTELGITHLVSVCPDYTSTGPNHLVVPVDDAKYEDLLIHLPKACAFIEDSLNGGGRVLVHCVMGISRSATVVAAYLMRTRKWESTDAVRFVKKRRPQIHPNYGFLKQLDTFSKCAYEPSPSHEEYRSWKRKQERDVKAFLNTMVDTVEILKGKLLLSSEFPTDSAQATSLLLELKITHILSLSPTEIPALTTSGLSPTSSSSSSLLSAPPIAIHKHIPLAPSPGSLLLALPDACNFIKEALKEENAQVLVTCVVESRAAVVVCAALMDMENMSPEEAFTLLEDALPLFNPTLSFSRVLELFRQCDHHPTQSHPLVQEWLISKGSSGIGATSLNLTRAGGGRKTWKEDAVGRADLSAFEEALGAR